MASRYRNLIYSTAEYTHTYDGFRGVELNASSLTTSGKRLAYSQNMYKDYDGDGAEVIESIPGFRCFAHYGKSIHALYYQRSPSGNEDHILVHVGDKLVRHPVSDIYRNDAVGESIATVEDNKSFGFEYGRYFYVMDTKRILQVSDDGRCRAVGDSGAYPYVPTTYVSGEAYEQRNLLTDDFKEEFYVADPSAYLYLSKGMKISVTDPYLRYCTIKGIESDVSGEIYLPAHVNISGIQYKVLSVDDYAFSGNTSVTDVYISEGITKIGSYAFSGCTALRTVVTPSTLTHMSDHAFSGCTSLHLLYLGASLTHVGNGAFLGCAALTSINYALGEDELDKIDGASTVTAKTVNYKVAYEAIKISLPFNDKVHGITSVKVDDVDVEFDMIHNGDFFEGVTLTFPSLADATGIKVEIQGSLMPLDEDWAADMTTLSSASSYLAIVNCRIAEVFDGRIFFSGNPDYPNTVFYTERAKPGRDDALYVGRYNYFNDGVGSYKVRSILAVRDMLAVFKEGDDGSGSIFYHRKEGTDLGALNTIYPVAYVHSGICSVGGAISFLDDPVFLTSEGLMALNSENINYQRNVACRSHNVNYALLKEDLSCAHLCEWLGYLAVGINGKIFLADSRATFTHPVGSHEYEWFLAADIGAYTGDKTVYRYSSDANADTVTHPTLIGKAVNASEVYSAAGNDGSLYYYVPDGSVKYSVEPTEEKDGGEFFPATVFISHDKLLFFATDNGHICVFNNDMRGVAPDAVKASAEYDAEEYAKLMGTRLHPCFYSFAGHAPKYVIKTALDDCGVPHLTKSSVKKSLVIKAKSYLADSIDCEVVTDGGDPVYVGSLPYSDGSFANFDFLSVPWRVSVYASVAMPEKEKRWIEKQIVLTSHLFSSPISIWSISYRYVIKGKIKNNV